MGALYSALSHITIIVTKAKQRTATNPNSRLCADVFLGIGDMALVHGEKQNAHWSGLQTVIYINDKAVRLVYDGRVALSLFTIASGPISRIL